MKQTELEQAALRLSASDRADLATKLLLSLESSPEENVSEDWLREARRRADDIDQGRVTLVPADEVRSKVRNLIG